MTNRTTPAARRPWIRPRLTTLATSGAQNGLVALNFEGLGKGS